VDYVHFLSAKSLREEMNTRIDIAQRNRKIQARRRFRVFSMEELRREDKKVFLVIYVIF